MEPSILDIIAQSTAKTIEDVSKLYHETCAGEAPHEGSGAESSKEEAAERAETQGPAPGSKKAAGSAERAEPPSFRYGTPFPDIIRFTKDVEVFTRHIDAQTRGAFGQDEGEAKKGEGK